MRVTPTTITRDLLPATDETTQLMRRAVEGIAKTYVGQGVTPMNCRRLQP